MIWNRQVRRRDRSAAPCLEPLEGRALLTSGLQGSLNPGGGVYGIDALGGLAHYQKGALPLTIPLDGAGIEAISVGKTSTGADDVFVRASGTEEIYRWTAATGFVDLHSKLVTFEATTGGEAFGVGFDGLLYHFRENVGFERIAGGAGIASFSAGHTASGVDVLYLQSTNHGEAFEWRPSAGFLDLGVSASSVNAGYNGAFLVGVDGTIDHVGIGPGVARVGGSHVVAVSVGTDSSGFEDLYARTSDGHIYYDSVATGLTTLGGQLQFIVATPGGGAFGIGDDGELYQVTGLHGRNVQAGNPLPIDTIDGLATGLDASGSPEVFVHYDVVNALGVKVGMVGEYQPSVGAIVPVLDDVS